MQLGVFDRLILLNVLPTEGDILSIRTVHQLRQALAFTDAELQVLDLHFGRNRPDDHPPEDAEKIFWNHAADVAADVEIGPRAHTLIAEALKRLSDQRKLGEQHLSLYERFVEAV